MAYGTHIFKRNLQPEPWLNAVIPHVYHRYPYRFSLPMAMIRRKFSLERVVEIASTGFVEAALRAHASLEPLVLYVTSVHPGIGDPRV